MRQFYKYIIYRLYTWSINGPSNSTPVFNVVATLAFVHLCQLALLTVIVFKSFSWKMHLPGLTSYIAVLATVALIAHYYLFYNKKRWEGYIKEFKNESPKESLKGKIYVLSYLMGSTFGVILLMYLINILFK